MPSALTRISALALLAGTMATAQERVAPWGNESSPSAFEAREQSLLAGAKKAVDRILAASGERTIDNTLAPYDDALRQLNEAAEVARLMEHASPAGFDDKASTILVQAEDAITALHLNAPVYQALSALNVSSADGATRYYVQRQIQQFDLAGVGKDEPTRKQLLELDHRVAVDESAFERNLAQDPRVVAVIDPADLDGLPQDFLDSHPEGTDGMVRIPADETTLPVVMKYAESPDFRRRFTEAYCDRAYPKNREVLRDMLEARYQIARLLNFDSWVDLRAQGSMIGGVRYIDIFLNGINTGDKPVMDAEWEMLLDEKRKEDPLTSDLYAYDYQRLAMLVRKDEFNLDEAEMRQYFPYSQVEQRVLRAMGALFHVELQQDKNAVLWAPGVEAFDVLEEGKRIGRIYLDMHPRPGKFTGNEMLPVVDGVRGKQLPEAALLCNFPAPSAHDPGLMEHDEVVALVHQMGHALHHIFAGGQRWAGSSGIRVEADFAEVPALMFEDWLRNPQVLASVGHHYKSGAALTSEQISRINTAFTFGRTIEGVALPAALAYISNDLHRHNPKGFDLNRMTLYDLRQYGRLMPLVAEGSMYAGLYPLVSESSVGYAHLWDKVIAEDFYQQFVRDNLLEGNAAAHFRQAVLEPGGSKPANDIVKAYLGRIQDLTAFQSWMGAEFHEVPMKKAQPRPLELNKEPVKPLP